MTSVVVVVEFHHCMCVCERVCVQHVGHDLAEVVDVCVCESHPCRLWQSSDKLLGRGKLPPSNIDAIDIEHYFDNKVARIHAGTAGAGALSFTCCTVHVSTPTTPADVIVFVLSLLDKQCLSDPLLTWLLEANVDILSPFLNHLYNSCLEHGLVPSSFKSGYVTLLLKRADLYAADVKSFRPITNRPIVYKLLERAACGTAACPLFYRQSSSPRFTVGILHLLFNGDRCVKGHF